MGLVLCQLPSGNIVMETAAQCIADGGIILGEPDSPGSTVNAITNADPAEVCIGKLPSGTLVVETLAECTQDKATPISVVKRFTRPV